MIICADFFAGANLDNGDQETLLFLMTGFFRLLHDEQRQAFIEDLREEASRARCVQHLNACGGARLHDSRCAANGNSTRNLITTRLSQLLPSEHGWNDCIAQSVKLAYYHFGRIPPTSTSNSKRFKISPLF